MKLNFETILLGMLIFVPISFAAEFFELNPIIIFALSGLGIIPLASLIAGSTEEIAVVLGPAIGGLLNATFGNATEIVVSIVALRQGLVEVVKASLIGSMIANLLLALGLAIFLGGIYYKDQEFKPSVARLNSSLLTLSIIVLVTPSAIHYTSKGLPPHTLDYFSYAVSILLLLFYVATLLFSMKTHKDLFALEEAEDHAHEKPALTKPIVILLVATVVLVFVSDILVGSLQEAVKDVGFTELFTGVILLPLFSGVVEYITCVKAGLKNQMDLALAVGIGSTLQIVLFATPVLVLIGAFMEKPMDLEFNFFSVIALAMTILITNSISSDGNSNWLEGTLLLITYAVLGIAFYFHP